ncbi:MAG: hypothetical protein Pg6C_00670 [Treponemataceae bacterium]|nr:MAG: hypothetical protein Pg6C_00670 [Treponemataceae bacterium]
MSEKKERDADETGRYYFYLLCRGKYENGDSGGRRCICSGHIFTYETGMNYCPACGNKLAAIKSKEERPEAITCALDKCFGCGNREQSAAVNVEHCLGGASRKNGRIRKIIGTKLCDGCPCAACCKEIIDDVYVVKKHGFAAVKAKSLLREYARHILREKNGSEEMEMLFDKIRAKDAVLRDIRDETFWRWAIDVITAAEKQMAAEDNAKNIQYLRGTGYGNNSGGGREPEILAQSMENGVGAYRVSALI